MQRSGIPISVSSVTLLLFNMCYHASALLLGILSLLFFSQLLWQQLSVFHYLWIAGIFVKIFFVTSFLLLVFSKKIMPQILFTLLKLLTKIRIIKRPAQVQNKIEMLICEYQQASSYIQNHLHILGQTFIITTLHLLCLYAIPFWICHAFGIEGTTLIKIIAVQSALTICTEALPIPGAIGIAESGFFILYHQIFGNQLLAPALLLCRGCNYYLPLIAGGITTLYQQIKKSPIRITITRTQSAPTNIFYTKTSK